MLLLLLGLIYDYCLALLFISVQFSSVLFCSSPRFNGQIALTLALLLLLLQFELQPSVCGCACEHFRCGEGRQE